MTTEIRLPEVLTPGEVAAALRTTAWTAQRMCRDGELNGAFRIGGRWRIPRATVAALMRGDGGQ
jgi:excisionase family DNA binding protein